MDAESEAYVQGAIDNLASEKLTLIIIAHRLATIKNANKESLHNIIFAIAYKVGCLFPIVVSSEFRMGRYPRVYDHREDSPHFMIVHRTTEEFIGL